MNIIDIEVVERAKFLGVADSGIVVSQTAEQRGFGSDKFKRVVGLTKAERAFVRAGGIVAFQSERLSGGNSGTYWRVCKDAGRYGIAPRVPSDEVLRILDAYASE